MEVGSRACCAKGERVGSGGRLGLAQFGPAEEEVAAGRYSPQGLRTGGTPLLLQQPLLPPRILRPLRCRPAAEAGAAGPGVPRAHQEAGTGLSGASELPAGMRPQSDGALPPAKRSFSQPIATGAQTTGTAT